MDLDRFARTNPSKERLLGTQWFQTSTRGIGVTPPVAVKIQGTIAKARAGNPEPPFGFGKLTIAIAPASGTWSRFVSSSI
jgi:hypothetical protein